MGAPPPDIFAYSAPLLDGHMANLSDWRGRVLLIVNTASRCGFTPQYAELERIYRIWKDRGLEVLAFPSNQFGRQEPGSAEEIRTFCERNYGITFPVFSKIDVNGAGAHPLYRFLKKQQSGFFGSFTAGRIQWNFTKFLVDRQGRVVARYGPATPPSALAAPIERLLGPAPKPPG